MNFVFFNPDELRADCLGCYGHPLVRTPNLDRLAAEGVRFAQCHTQHPVCTPSRCCTMTGLYPHVTGHRTLWHLLRPHEPNLVQALHDAGYHVRFHGKNDLLSQAAMRLWTDYCGDTPGSEAAANLYQPGEAGYYSFLYAPLDVARENIRDVRRLQEGLTFLRSAPRQPFFLNLTLSWPHPPYTVPPSYYELYSPDDLPPLRPTDLPDKPLFQRLIRRYRHLEACPPELFRRVMAVYLGMVTFVDDLLGELLRTLEETGLANDTAVVFYSDHGDWAGDYGLVEKWPSALDDCITRVPLVVRLPGGARGGRLRRGHVVEEPVELFDLTPTLLELAGLAPAYTQFGRSLMPQLHGAAGDPERAVYAEGGYDPHEPHAFEGRPTEAIFRDPAAIYYPKGLQQQEAPTSVCRSAMVRTRDYKLIRRTLDICELYDLRADPGELHNVYTAPAYADVRAQLETRLLDWYLHTADMVPPDEDPRGWVRNWERPGA